MALTLTRERVEETVAQYVYPRPITFDEWLETGDRESLTHLINGTPVEQPMVQLEHEKLNLWLLHVLALYVRRAGLGTVLGTRSSVQISQYQGQVPDLFFVRREREHLITSKATRGAPDLVIEIISSNDRRADINATEADYRTLGVDEIVYIDLPRLRVRVLRRTDTGYQEETLSGQPLTLRSLGGLTLAWDWLFVEPRPDEIDTVLSLLGERSR
ncbi:MAG: Uma2 family endonuclease [Armatimonadetes bacterium]|nr:Uma2 family endonuclease [Armatimonadota bacterium]